MDDLTRPNYEVWLFNGSGYLGEILERKIVSFGNEIRDIDREILLNANINELKDKWITDLTVVEFPELILDKKHLIYTSDKLGTKEVLTHTRLTYKEVRYLGFLMGIEFKGDKSLFKYRPRQAICDQYRINRQNNPKAVILDNELQFIYYYEEGNEESLGEDFEDDIALTARFLQWCKEEVDQYNSKIPKIVNGIIENRLAEIKKDFEFISKLKYPLKKYSDVPKILKLPEKRESAKIIQDKISSESEQNASLDINDYYAILEILQSMSTVMERSPVTFHKLQEEEIRDFFLVHLNGHYKGLASGETFNCSGKTDILIRHENNNIFIAECKIWRGESNHIDTIDQLVNYVTWRDTKTAILVFNKNKGLSGVLEKIKESTMKHTLFKSEATDDLNFRKETIFPLLFTNKHDNDKTFQLTVMVYDLPSQ